MYAIFSQIMSGFSLDRPIEYLCGFLLYICIGGFFFRFLYTLFKPY